MTGEISSWNTSSLLVLLKVFRFDIADFFIINSQHFAFDITYFVVYKFYTFKKMSIAVKKLDRIVENLYFIQKFQ